MESNKKRLKAKINSYRVEQIALSGGRVQPKVVFEVITSKNHNFQISVAEIEVTSKSGDKEKKFQGLWLEFKEGGSVAKNSTLYKMMKHFEVESLEDMVGKTVTVKTDPNNFYAIEAC